MHTHVFIWDCAANLLITDPVTYNSVGDIENGRISMMQLVSLAILLFLERRWILDLLKIWLWFPVVMKKKDTKTEVVENYQVNVGVIGTSSMMINQKINQNCKRLHKGW